jgi:hypothetical protein
MLQVTCDKTAILKLLRQLEMKGRIQLWAVNIKELANTRRIPTERKALPSAIIGSKFAKLDNCKIA